MCYVAEAVHDVVATSLRPRQSIAHSHINVRWFWGVAPGLSSSGKTFHPPAYWDARAARASLYRASGFVRWPDPEAPLTNRRVRLLGCSRRADLWPAGLSLTRSGQ